MKEKIGQVFSIKDDNKPLPGLTISRQVLQGERAINYFSLAEGSDISPESYPYYKLLILAAGRIGIRGYKNLEIEEGQAFISPIGKNIGVRALKDSVYTEIIIRKDDWMNEKVKAGEVFKLKDLLPYREGSIVNMDLMHNDQMKLALMAFDQGTGLSEHTAPGDALVFALDGKAKIGYEGEEYSIKAGENFHFAKGGAHYVKADGKFKMALLISLD